MKLKASVFGILAPFLFAGPVSAQQLSPHWENLTAEDFVKAIDASRHVCVLPFGILEKHGPAGTLGTDLINVRGSVFEAVKTEYAVVFPEYYFGEIADAREQPGTIAYSADLQLHLLQATTDEMARNGCAKIIIVNGHGGNTSLLTYFLRIQSNTNRHYVVYVESPGETAGRSIPAAAKPSSSKPGIDGHAGEAEVSSLMANAPGTAHPERSGEESGANQHRINLPAGLTTAVTWYASYPNHYAGDSAGASEARGLALRHLAADNIVEAIRFVKGDTAAPALQEEFFSKTDAPLNTKQ